MMRRIAWSLTVVTFVAAVTAAEAERDTKAAGETQTRQPAAIRGVPWGASLEQAAEIIPFGEYGCTEMTIFEPPETWCDDDFKIGDVKATSQFRFVDNKLVAVNILYSPAAFEDVKSTMIEKYGTPASVRTIPTRARRGLDYKDEAVLWKFPLVTIEMHRFGPTVSGPTVSRGAAYFSLNTWLAEKERRSAAMKKKAKDAF
jgi:hypothetical protein